MCLHNFLLEGHSLQGQFHLHMSLLFLSEIVKYSYKNGRSNWGHIFSLSSCRNISSYCTQFCTCSRWERSQWMIWTWQYSEVLPILSGAFHFAVSILPVDWSLTLALRQVSNAAALIKDVCACTVPWQCWTLHNFGGTGGFANHRGVNSLWWFLWICLTQGKQRQAALSSSALCSLSHAYVSLNWDCNWCKCFIFALGLRHKWQSVRLPLWPVVSCEFSDIVCPA